MLNESTRRIIVAAIDIHRVLGILVPVLQDFPSVDTVIEPLIPVPVNVNTASIEVLTALFAEVGTGARVPPPNAQSRQRLTPPLSP